jgi:ABC-type antimicrobial peptide transport system ATPase subunit
MFRPDSHGAGRALAARPKLLLLDEPAARLNHTETGEIDALIRKVADSGVTVVLVEHDMKLVMNCRTTSSCSPMAGSPPKAQPPRSAPIPTWSPSIGCQPRKVETIHVRQRLGTVPPV